MNISCKSDYPSYQEIQGKWVSSDGSTIYFQENNKFIAENLPTEFFYIWDTVPEKTFNGTGDWEIQESRMKSTGYNTIVVNFNDVSINSSKFQLELMIKGKGFFSNKKPWKSIFLFIGDPDNGEMYHFFKKK